MSDIKEELEPSRKKVVLVVPKQHVKTVKTALEECGKLDRTARIVLETGDQDEDQANRATTESIKTTEEQRMRVPTTITYPRNSKELDSSLSVQESHTYKSTLLEELGLASISPTISIAHVTPPTKTASVAIKNPLHRALEEGLKTLPDEILTSLNLTIQALLQSFPEGYSVYKPMLLLPHNALSSPPWATLLTTYPPTHALIQPLWTHLAKATSTTHIAINSPIPLQNNSESENFLRSPVNITPLHGSFGPPPTQQTISSPTQTDFAAALWVSTTQNGIHQTWAPLYTMFSRGNIREKTRILHLPAITPHSTAVDMYAGIGYFAFSYKKAGVGRVVCFELNPWSVEGLRRGAEMNGWRYVIVEELEMEDWKEMAWEEEGVDFLIFRMSNVHAVSVLTRLRSCVAPVRHVNLGLLPDARAAWRDAVGLVDAGEGGCVRVHENVGLNEIGERKGEVESVYQGYLDDLNRESGRKVKVEHVERVKMYAPGVVHCVFDVHVGGSKDIESI